MSKDKGNKSKKKAPGASDVKKVMSDYQSGKTSATKTELVPISNKRKQRFPIGLRSIFLGWISTIKKQ